MNCFLFYKKPKENLFFSGLNKLLLIMKITFLMVLVFVVVVHAEGTAQKVTLSFKNAKIEQVFTEITRQTNYRFLYSDEVVRKAALININVKNVDMGQVLDQLIDDQEMTYRLIGQTVTINASSSRRKISAIPVVPDIDIRITGTVTDPEGKPLPGASVTVKGNRSNGATTATDGRFVINVPDGNAVLLVSYVGYKTREIPLEGKTTVAVSLQSDDSNLDEIVVVGYGTQKRKDLTGSVGSVDSKQISELSVTNVEQALLGKVAGVQVKPGSGEPGAPPQIMVRGIGSISAGAAPLYVVDGFPTANIESLNPNDIESMDILKDASATAIYGSRGSNGVIIINTKRGKSGKSVITLETYYGLQKISKRPIMKNAMEMAQYGYEGTKNQNIDAGNDVSGPPNTWKIPVAQDFLDVISGKNTYDADPLNEVLRTAPQQTYQLAATGGNENIKYAVSGEYSNQDGIIINSNFKRYSLRANIDAKLTKNLSLSVNLNPSYITRDQVIANGAAGGVTSTSIIGLALVTHPFLPLLDQNGNYTVFSGLASQGNIPNVLALAREVTDQRKSMGFQGNVNLEYRFLEDFKLKVQLGGSTFNTNDYTFRPKLPAFINTPATGRTDASMQTNWLTETTLNYDKVFSKHTISGLVGYTTQSDMLQSEFLSSDKFPNNLVPLLSATGGVITNGSTDISKWTMLSYLARVNYNYDGKYYLTASIRTDGSSRFGSENKWGVFPSAALAWRISQEDFLKSASFINDMKIRLSYGKTGNNNIGDYEHQGTISYLTYPLGGAPVAGYAQARIANPYLTWEKQSQVNAGVDISVFNSRLQLTIDHFQSRNTDLLLDVPIPAVNGFSTTLKNIGEVKNTGWELTASTVNVKGKFEWSTNFNISTYKNEVVKLGPKGDPIYSGASVTMIGQPIGMFYGWLADGVFMNQAELDKGPIFHPGAADRSRVGDVRFKDVSGPNGKPDGIIDGLDKTIMGSPYPDFYYGMTNRFAFKNFSLSFSLQGAHGNEIFNQSKGQLQNLGIRLNQLAQTNNYWKSEQEPGDGINPRPNEQSTGNYRGSYSTIWLSNASYLRINNITFSYLFPEKLVEKIRVGSLSVFVSATNPFIITKYYGFNPDVNNSDNALTPGVELNNYPLAKSIRLGLNVKF
jgi:TonB-linked SusC/RagA family outer membrane protein